MDITRPDRAWRRRRKAWITLAVGSAILIFTSAWLYALAPSTPALQRSDIAIGVVVRGDFQRKVRGPGLLIPKELRWIAAETAARVDRVIVKPGARVQPDTLIIQLSNPEVDDRLTAAVAALSAAQADLAARRAELSSGLLDQRSNLAAVDAEYQMAMAQREAEAPAAAQGVIPQVVFRRTQITEQSMKARVAIERERVERFQDNMAAQLRAAQTRLDQLEASRMLAQRHADALRVSAGIAGVLQQVPVEEGQQVVAGTNLARVAGPRDLRADIRIAETQARDIAIGQPALVDTRNGIVPGRVLRVDPAVNNGTVTVEIDLIGELPPGARPDLSVDATIEIERLPNTLFVERPAAAAAGTNISLFRVDVDGRFARRVPVSLGRMSTVAVEVVAGLQPGDAVVLSDTSAFADAARIRLK